MRFRRTYRGPALPAEVKAGGTRPQRGEGAALYFTTPPAYVGTERPVRVSHLDGTQTAFTPEEAREWLADCIAWLDNYYPPSVLCEACNGHGRVVVGED